MCTTLEALPRLCPPKLLAGVNKLYMIAADDLDVATGATNGDTFILSGTTHIITAIGLKTSKKFIEIGLLKDTTDLTSEIKKNISNGTFFYSPKMELVLADNTPENQKFVESVSSQKVAVLIKARNGKFYAFGLNGETEFTGGTQSFGKAAGDDFGYKLTFEGTEATAISQVDPTLAVTLY